MNQELMTLDFWQDTVIYEGKTLPVGALACDALNVPADTIAKMNEQCEKINLLLGILNAGQDASALCPIAKEAALAMLDILSETPPFSYMNISKHRERIERVFTADNALKYVEFAIKAVTNSLMTAYSGLNEELDEIGVEYESYLQNMGRQLFYTVASSYITLYLAIVFLVVANTIVGVQFLMSQQKTGRRYQTLIRLGATYESLCQSAGKQIAWFMGLPVLVAAVSSLFGVRALFTGILSSRTRGTVSEMLLVSAAMILLLCVIEYIYMRVVKRSSDRYLLTLMQPQREE